MFEKRFVSKVDVSRGPIERSVVSMVRLKAPNYLSGAKVPERKEYVYYQEVWSGKNHLGLPLNPVAEHYEGVYKKQFTRPVFNQSTGEIDYYQIDLGAAQTIYYIPFSKKAVDDIISKSVHTEKDSIKFIIKFASEDSPLCPTMPTRCNFSYEQFANWSWTEICKKHYMPTVQAYTEFINKEKAKDGLSFKPS